SIAPPDEAAAAKHDEVAAIDEAPETPRSAEAPRAIEAPRTHDEAVAIAVEAPVPSDPDAVTKREPAIVILSDAPVARDVSDGSDGNDGHDASDAFDDLDEIVSRPRPSASPERKRRIQRVVGIIFGCVAAFALFAGVRAARPKKGPAPLPVAAAIA